MKFDRKGEGGRKGVQFSSTENSSSPFEAT